MRQLILILFTLFYSFNLLANPTIDSLLNEIKHAKTGIEEIDIYNKISEKYYRFDIQESEKYANKAIDYAKNIGYLKGEADALFNLSHIYLYGNFDIAFKYVNQALTIYKKLNLEVSIIDCYKYLSIIKSSLGEYHSALDYSEHILNYCIKQNDSLRLAAVLNNMGSYYNMLNKDSLANKQFFRAAEINKAIDNKLNLSVNYGNICVNYMRKNNLNEASEFLAKSYTLKKEIKDMPGIAWLHFLKGNIFELQNVIDSAFHYYHLSYQLSIQQKNNRQLEWTIKSIQQLHKKLNQTDSALFWLEQLQIIKDSIYDNEKIKDIYLHELKVQHEKENELKKLKHQAQNYKMIGLIIFLVLFIIIILLLLYTQNIKRKKGLLEIDKANSDKKILEEKLFAQNQELATYVLNLLNKNKLVSNVVDKLSIQLPKFQTENKECIQSIITDLKINMNVDIWNEFELRFNQVHPDFLKRLIKDYPDLTPNEIRLCSFLKMNLTTKEISQITHQTVQSIEKARLRLRKKLNLTDKETSIIYFLSKY